VEVAGFWSVLGSGGKLKGFSRMSRVVTLGVPDMEAMIEVRRIDGMWDNTFSMYMQVYFPVRPPNVTMCPARVQCKCLIAWI